MEKSLAQVAREAFFATTHSSQDLFDRVAKAVEAEVLSRLKKSEVEPVAWQELTFVQVAQWVEKHGSTEGLQWQWLGSSGKWWDEHVNVLYPDIDYRVAPKKVNDPDDPTTWEKGVAIFRRDYENALWVLDVFKGYTKGSSYKYNSERGVYRYAKLATPEQIEAWKLINGDL